MKAIWAVARRNFASALIPLIITFVVVAASTSSADSAFALSRGNYTWLYPVMLPFFVVFGNYRKLLNLNASKKSYYLGSLLTYAIAACAVSAVNIAIHLTIDAMNPSQTVVNLMGLFGWLQNGVIVAFFQQFAFLLFFSLFLHVFLSAQPYWYGWLADIVIVAVICVFIPIEPLRAVLVSFFQLILFNSTVWLHIAVCVIGSLIMYLLGLVILKRSSI